MDEKLNITIKLAGLPKIPLAVERHDEEIMRRAEKLVNELWSRWQTSTFAAEQQMKVMARVAFQFAVLYLRDERSLQQLSRLDDRLNEVLVDLPAAETPAS